MSDESLWLRPGQRLVVTVECERCEGYRWRAVNPYRNVRRALRVLEGERLGCSEVVP